MMVVGGSVVVVVDSVSRLSTLVDLSSVGVSVVVEVIGVVEVSSEMGASVEISVVEVRSELEWVEDIVSVVLASVVVIGVTDVVWLLV